MRGATRPTSTGWRQFWISIHAPHAGSDRHHRLQGRSREEISIHAPHAGSDSRVWQRQDTRQISIHAPHAGSDEGACLRGREREISIHAPHAGSDSPGTSTMHRSTNFNPRSPCGERLVGDELALVTGDGISIHAPHAGSDLSDSYWVQNESISIHAPHAGSDTGGFHDALLSA